MIPVVDCAQQRRERFAIFAAGDVAAPADGRARTYLLFLDGWAKDGDPNTMHSQTVGPLPFHGMSGYPYRDDERYPDGEAHRRYLAEWNTRPGRALVPDLLEAELPTSP